MFDRFIGIKTRSTMCKKNSGQPQITLIYCNSPRGGNARICFFYLAYTQDRLSKITELPPKYYFREI